jgi:hypothetical protein
MIRPNNRQPRTTRPPRSKTGGRSGGTTPPPGDGKKSIFPCLVLVSAPIPLALLFLYAAIREALI